jgi:restriction system protein
MCRHSTKKVNYLTDNERQTADNQEMEQKARASEVPMRRNRKRKKAMRRQRARLIVSGLAALVLLASLTALVLLASLTALNLWLLVLILSACLLIGGALAVFLYRRHIQQPEQWRKHIKTLNDLLRLTPTQFELITIELLRTQGFQHIRHTGGAGDLAADITCYTPQGQPAAVQCKRYAPQHRVGSPEIQQFIGMVTIHHHANVGIFVTTSTFTQPARALAKQHGVTLLDGPHLEWLVQQFYLPQQQQKAPTPA